MRKLRRLLFRLFFFIFLVIVGAIILNTLSFASKQVAIATIPKIEIADKTINRLAETIRIPTTSYATHVDTLAFETLHEFIDSNFVLVDSLLEKKVVNKFSLVYKWQGKNPKLKPILYLAHLDVVPVEGESLKKWSQAPYSGKIENDFIWGRGSLDDKVSALGLLEAIEILLKENYKPQRTVYLAFGHDEEIGGQQGAKAIAAHFEKQKINFEYILDEGMVVLEGVMPGIEKPIALIGNAEKGYTTLTLKVSLKDGGHSSMPPKETTIGILSKAISALEQNPFPAKLEGSTRALFDYTAPEMTLMNKTIFANLWLFEGLLKKQLSNSTTTNATIRTTTAPTILSAGVKENVLPTDAKAIINFRILPGETVESVIEYVKKTIDDDRVKIYQAKGAFSSNPSKISKIETFGFEVIQKTAQEIFPNVLVAPALVIAATDSRHYNNLSDNIYRFLPVHLQKEDLKRIHGIDERIGTEAYKDVIRFYHQLIQNSCK